MEKIARFTLVIICSIILFGRTRLAVKAFQEPSQPPQTETDQTNQPDITLLDEIDFQEIDSLLSENETTSTVQFTDIVKALIQGEELDKGWLLQLVLNAVLGEVKQSRDYMMQIILLAVAFAILYNFANVFNNAAVTDMSFYIVYMMMVAILIRSFQLLSGILTGTLNQLLEFMRALMPAFCMTMVFSASPLSATGFYQLTLFVIYIIEAILIHAVLPAVQVYILLELLNHLTKEDMISKLAELIKNSVEWVLKFLFTLVIGINVVQGLLSPVIDSFKTSMLAKTTGVLPGLGTAVNAVTEIMIGSGIIIKNGVGMAGIIFLLILCAGPMLKVGVMTILYKLSAAIIQPIADKRISGCVSGMGEGARLLIKVLITANVMFLVTIALITAATTWQR